MATFVGSNRYGKQNVRLLRVVRDSKKHQIHDMTCEMLLEGEFEASYSQADNTKIVPTETQKNTLYVMSKKYAVEPVELWCYNVALDVMSRHSHVSAVNIHVDKRPWDRIQTGQSSSSNSVQPHNHAFQAGSGGLSFTSLRTTRSGKIELSSGFKELEVLKTTQSGFAGFIKDEYTTLQDTTDRVMATKVFCEWFYGSSVDMRRTPFTAIADRVRRIVLQEFAGPPADGEFSASVQHTLYTIGKAVLAEFKQLSHVSFKLPNIHFYGVDFNKFKTSLTNNNEVFFTFDGARGQIEATIQRKPAAKL